MMLEMMRVWLGREEGQDLAEYGLIVALIAVVAIGALTVLGGNITDTIQSLADAI